MSTIVVLKDLWRRRILVASALIASAAISLLFVYQVSLAPPSLSQRSQVDAEGSIQILVDSANSPIADARRDLSGLTARAGVFARLMAGGNVVGQIAKETGIPIQEIDVAGPLPLPGEAPGISEAPLYVNPYRIEITQQAELPILTVVTRAPTVAEARALAAAAPGAISKEVEAIQAQQQTPLGKRVEFRVLGPAKAAVVDDTTSKKVAAAVFVVLALISLGLIIGLPRFMTAWRSVDVEASDPKAAADGAGAGASLSQVPEADRVRSSDPARSLEGERDESKPARDKSAKKKPAKGGSKPKGKDEPAERQTLTVLSVTAEQGDDEGEKAADGGTREVWHRRD